MMVATRIGPARFALGPWEIAHGNLDAFGVRWFITSVSGWSDPPASSGTTDQRVNDDGAWLGPAYYAARVVQVEGWLVADQWREATTALRRMTSAVPVSALTQLTLTEDDEALTAMVRQNGDLMVERSEGRVRFSVSLLAPDPRRYTTPITVDTGLPTSAGGSSLPIILPLTLGATVATGVLVVTNTGDTDSYPVFTVSGPITTGFTITDTAGRRLAYTGTVAAGRTLAIDTAARTALLDGVASRVVTGTWPRLVPGVNQFSFNSSTYDPGTRLAVTYRSARR